MTERPILFNGAMVRAILEDRKKQTRRVAKLPHANPLGQWEPTTFGGGGIYTSNGEKVPHQGAIWHTRTGDVLGCPYGQPGDRLWVRETWTWEGGSSTYPRDTPLPDGAYDKLYVRYAADGSKRTIETGGNVLPVPRQPPQREGEEYCLRDAPADFVYTGDNTYVDRLGRWWKRKIPAIHMPRWASRILLEVTDVRVQRVQDISEADSLAEGIDEELCRQSIGKSPLLAGYLPTCAFAYLWDSINAKRGFGWDANPWVWVIEFRRVEQ